MPLGRTIDANIRCGFVSLRTPLDLDSCAMEPIVQYPRARDAFAPRHALAATKHATALTKVLWGAPLEPAHARADAPAAADLLARTAAYSANRGMLDGLVADAVARGNRDAFGRIVAAVEAPHPPGLLPAVAVVAGGSAADNELAFPPLMAALRRRWANGRMLVAERAGTSVPATSGRAPAQQRRFVRCHRHALEHSTPRTALPSVQHAARRARDGARRWR